MHVGAFVHHLGQRQLVKPLPSIGTHAAGGWPDEERHRGGCHRLGSHNQIPSSSWLASSGTTTIPARARTAKTVATRVSPTGAGRFNPLPELTQGVGDEVWVVDVR